MGKDMRVKVEAPFAVYPAAAKEKRRMYLSNIDQTLVAPVGTLSFFASPPAMTFEEVVEGYVKAVSEMLVTYDFMGGRLKLSEDEERLEIDCNGAGALFAVASSDLSFDELGDITTPNLAFRSFVLCDHIALSHLSSQHHLPLFTLQATRFTCGAFVVGAGLNHCILDGISCFHMMINLASIAMGKGLPITPFLDRTLLKPRDPPTISYPHYEFSKISDLPPAALLATSFSKRGGKEAVEVEVEVQVEENVLRVFSISGEEIERLKEKSGRKCSSFEVVTAAVWKARTAAVMEGEGEGEEIATVLFPVDVRGKVEPALSKEYAGNAVVPGHARARVREVEESSLGAVVGRVQEGLRRMSNEYVRSALDWLEVHRGIPCSVRSFSVVAWWKLGMEQVRFPWGTPLHFGPLLFALSQDLLLLLPHPHGHGLNIVIALLPSHMSKFDTLFSTLLH